MLTRPLGATGARVSVLSLGAGSLGGGSLSEDAAGALLNGALDLGINLVDAAPSYGLAEERIGRHLAHRRGAFLLSTKGGYGVPGVPDWTGHCIVAGVDAALRRMRTDWLDVFHLHSCPKDVLLRDDILGAVQHVVQSGRVRFAAYSGEGDALEAAIDCGVFSVVQLSLNIVDQRSLDSFIPKAASRGLGILTKRTLANAVWRFSERPGQPELSTYWDRLRALELPPQSIPLDEMALRFSAFHPGVSSCLVGTSRLENPRSLVAALDRGPLPNELSALLRQRFQSRGAGWAGQI